MLWTGLVVAGVAACGDDVTVNPPTATVHSISVAPNGVTVGIGANVITMSAAVNADAGVTNLAVTWSTSDASKATVSQTGQVTTLAAGSVAIIACSQLVPSVCGNASLTIASNAPVATSVTVTPGPSASFVVGQAPVTFTAAVLGSNNPPQTVTWSTASGATNVVSVGAATGIVTIVGAGTEVVKACSTVTPTVCGSTAVTVQVAAPTQVSIQGITQGGTTTPVNLANVSGQVDVVLNVDPGAGSLVKVQVLIDGIVAAEQCFIATCPVSLRAELPAANAVQQVVLSLNTAQVKKLANGLYIPVAFNGPRGFSAKLFTSLTTSGVSSNVTPVVLQNQDAMIAAATGVPAVTLVQASSSPSAVNGVTTWYKGNVNVSGGNYVSFFPVTPQFRWVSNNAGCGPNSSNATSGTPQTGITTSGVFTCNNTVEAQISLTGAYVVTPGTAPAADVVYVPAVGFSTVGTQYTVNGDARFNLFAAAAPVVTGPFIDNKAPTITPNEIGFIAGCSPTIPTPGCWIGTNYNLLADFPAVDAGSGAPVVTVFNLASTGPTVCGSTVFTVATLAENTSPTAYSACATATDALGNTSGPVAGFNAFGVDKTAPTIAFSGTYTPTSATPAEVNVLPAQNLNYNVQDNNSGLQVTALTIAYTRTLNNGGVVSTTACAPAATYDDLTGAGTAPLSLITPVDLSTFCTLPGENRWDASAVDRAGNVSATVTRAMEYNPAIPVINAINIIPNYAAAAISNVDVLATDDEDLRSAEMWLHTTTNAGNDIRVVFGPKAGLFSGIWGADWDGSLFLATALGTTARLALPATYALAGYVENVAGITQAQAATDSISVNVYDTFGAASGATTVALNPAFVTTTSYASSNPWAAGLGNVIAAAINTVGSSCNFEYSTPTNNPEVFARIWVMNENAGQFTLLADVNSQPTLISDNGIQRLYRYTLSGSLACANVGGTGVAANNIIAIKSNVGAIIF